MLLRSKPICYFHTLIKAIQQSNKRRKAYGDFLKESLNFKNGTFVPPTDDTCDRCVRDSNPPFLAILYPLSYFVYDKSRIRTYDPSINTTVLLLCQYIAILWNQHYLAIQKQETRTSIRALWFLCARLCTYLYKLFASL